MAETVQKFDDARATDILEKARELKMYLQPIPDSAEMRVMEAERLVELARQADHVARTAGKQEGIKHEAVTEILFLAEVDGGTPSAQAAPESPVPAEEPAGPAAEVGGEGQPPEPAAGSQTPSSPELPPQPAPRDGSAAGPQQHEHWGDEQGQVWVVDRVLGQSIEAHPEQPKDSAKAVEKTLLPLDFLKRRLEEPSPGDSPEPSSSPPSPASTSEQPSTSSDKGESGGGTSPPASAPPSSPPSPSPSTGSTPNSAETADDPEYQSLLDRVQADYERARLPLPGDVPEPPEMPSDLTGVPDLQARKLHSQFNACAARAHYLLGLERARKVGCSRLRKQAMKPAMATAREQLGSKVTVTEVKQVAENDAQVERWRELEDLHAGREDSLQVLHDIYQTHVTVLSRDWTMRESGERGS